MADTGGMRAAAEEYDGPVHWLPDDEDVSSCGLTVEAIEGAGQMFASVTFTLVTCPACRPELLPADHSPETIEAWLVS